MKKLFGWKVEILIEIIGFGLTELITYNYINAKSQDRICIT